MGNEVKYLGYSEKWLTEHKSVHTATEIAGQSTLWLTTYNKLLSESVRLKAFMEKVLSETDLDIVLTGAGTSAYIGQVLEPSFRKYTGKLCRALPTTDIVSSPSGYLYEQKTTLLISFARSGNSPESVAAVDLANQCCNKVFHLFITCNPEGKLAQMKGDNIFCFTLPPESNDKSLAMTGSFSAMLMTGHLISRIEDLATIGDQVKRTSAAAIKVIEKYNESLQKLTKLDFTRGIFLGSGALQGSAREAHLKLQELTDGKVMCQFDTYLGFRHGPKAVINGQSLIVYLLSSEEYVERYESDLVEDINKRKDGMFRLGVGISGKHDKGCDLFVALENAEGLDEPFFALLTVLPCQILAFHKSIQVGLSPDEPSVSGNISRVVKGVNIYPFKSNTKSLQS
jgi:tagatose-6-phosphate ketose/aldose isomerase